MIKRSTTAKYPTRYAAFERDSEMVVYDGDADGRIEPLELAVYSHVMPNTEYAALRDGVYCEIRKLPNAATGRLDKGTARVYVDCHATRPTAGREQRGWSNIFNASLGSGDGRIPAADIERAIGIAEGFIAQAEAWIGETK